MPLSFAPSALFYLGIDLGLTRMVVAFFLVVMPCMAQVSPPQPSPRPTSSPQTQPPPSTTPSQIDAVKTSSTPQTAAGSQVKPKPVPPQQPIPMPITPRIPNLRKPVIATTPLSISSVQTHMGILMTAGDLAQRFGAAGQVGLDFCRIAQGKWLMGGSITHLFSNSVREQDIFSNISTESGDVITRDGVFEDYRLRLFGWLMSARIGRLILFDPSRPNRGLSIELGVGIMQHKIRIETPVLNSPQLSADYKRGYDRLSNGLCLSPALGYLHYAPNRRINYFIRLEGNLAQTRNRRTVNYDTGLPDHRLRRDALWGVRAGWILPLYRRAEKEVNFF
ncbi:MAG: hypothetical protein FJ344_06290 [Sphingomonadales bacterium]|nr:hypothetical protein [Sphingomonadales bacterium]